MAGRIRDADVALVRERARLDEVIGERLALRPAGGGRLKGLCPFHDEKSPSFSVNPALGFFHCLAGETAVLTWDGVRPIAELAGGVHRVVDRHGRWVDAPFRSFGHQQLHRIVLQRDQQTKVVRATSGHRWFVRATGIGVQGERERTTVDLRPGDRLAHRAPAVRPTTPSPGGIALGTASGDETRGRSRGSHARLRGDEDGALLTRSPRSRTTVISGDLRVPDLPGHGPGRVEDLPSAGTAWVVRSVEETDDVEEVFCAEVEDGHAFVLEDDILTGNCFGCGASGDVISFLRDAEHLSFVEAVESLANRYGVQLTYEQGSAAPRQQGSQRARLLEAHRAAAAFYAEQLGSPGAAAARTFLAERGFDRDAATTYGLGYAPGGWDTLVRHLRGKGFSGEELLGAGLASQGRQGPVDRFRDRLVWPIRDLPGEIIGFGARKLSTDPRDDSPKYLNTPETPLYKKSAVLYGVDQAKKEIARRRQVVVVEGYTDVMACHLAGVPTAVATCGTAFGSEHIGVLRRLLMDAGGLRGEVVFLFDGDAAGQKAALRAFDSDQEFVSQTFIAVSPGGSDPCELRLARGDAAVRDLVASRVPLVEFAVRSALGRYDLETAEGRVAALSAAAPLVAKIKDRALRPEYARRLAGWLGMEVEGVMGRVAELAGDPRGAPRQRRLEPAADTAALAVEREAVKLAVQVPVLAAPLFDGIDEQTWSDPGLRAVRELVAKAGGVSGTAGGEAWVAALRELAGDDALRTLVTVLAVEPLRSDTEPDARYAGAVLARLQEFALSRRIAELKPQLQRVNPVEEPERYGRLFAELVQLEQTVRALRERGAGAL